ncbi:MAG: DUF4262 domain-containing protein [Streptosporangiaceae bacterium]|jgi:hypothetical protein|nr:DUF4262 domain-containing protein [Actinomycetota bacterium]
MGWANNLPVSTRGDDLDRVRTLIAEHRWAVQDVDRDRFRPASAYTVGLTEHGLPELVVAGLPGCDATRLLNYVASHVLQTAALGPGDQIPLHSDPVIVGPMIEAVEVTVPAANLPVATRLYGQDLRALQLVYADDRGHWPWDPGYRGFRGDQPVLGARAGGHRRVDLAGSLPVPPHRPHAAPASH